MYTGALADLLAYPGRGGVRRAELVDGACRDGRVASVPQLRQRLAGAELEHAARAALGERVHAGVPGDGARDLHGQRLLQRPWIALGAAAGAADDPGLRAGERQGGEGR